MILFLQLPIHRKTVENRSSHLHSTCTLFSSWT